MKQPPPQPPATAAPTLRFFVTPRQRLHPGALVLATLAIVSLCLLIGYTLKQTAQQRATRDAGNAAAAAHDDGDDDPNRIDTIYLGDPADAPRPARKGDHVSPVHPTILVQLPRFGEQTGLIPNSTAGHLLFSWLAAFNKADQAALRDALPDGGLGSPVAAQMELRQATHGFALLSAKEVQPGLLVFRLQAQTPEMTEVLGTLQMRQNTNPPAIASFSLRAVIPKPAAPRPAAADTGN